MEAPERDDLTCVCPVEGALGVVGGAVVQGAVEGGALVENRRHVAVGGQRRPQLWIYLRPVAGVRAVQPCRKKIKMY